MFLPTTKKELTQLGWECLDVIIVTGDTYLDSPYIGAAVIGKILLQAGYKVGIIAQPELENQEIARLGEPSLFWGVTSGSVDSMVANYTATKKRRQQDDFTPGGINNRRPDRAVLAYTNLIRRHFKNTVPIVLGGIEASLRRIAHYDYWGNELRRSILLDAKANYLVYGMGEKTILQLAEKLKQNQPCTEIRGLCYIDQNPRLDYLELPSFPSVKADKYEFIKMFHLFYQQQDPFSSKGLCQQQDTRYLIHNPPQFPLTQIELNQVYELDYERNVHPYYRSDGAVRALETIRFSITTHRGCYGECNFCSIAMHQGRLVHSRSEASIIKEVEALTKLPDFKGYLLDVGGPTANMYGVDCETKKTHGACTAKRCLFPRTCKNLPFNHEKQLHLLQRLRRLPGIKKIFIASGIRYDLILNDSKSGLEYLREIMKYHLSGQMKIAPEHTEDKILKLMGKPNRAALQKFREHFNQIKQQNNQEQFLTYYFIAAHPGTEQHEMEQLHQFAVRELKLCPEQVQIFTPLPSTYSTLMYYTGLDPFTLKPLYVEKDQHRKELQKQAVIGKRK